MTLRLHDSATRETRDFVPRTPGRVGVYVCGLTVQSAPHVGHVRSAVNFDVLRRWLTARGYAVDFIRNVTDIDDKILTRAAERGVPWYAHAAEVKRELDRAYDALAVLPPTYEPLATGHVPEMLELIGTLIDRGHAYAAEDGSGDVYFDVRSWPAYGELTGQRVDDMADAADADPRGKRDPRDFALWKGWKADSEPRTASWPSPWGRGRPGWHIECSAMAGKYLGEAFDIHGGGLDLRFPHHENEQAQSRAAGHDFAAYWMHNAWITTAGEKMSKSLGNSLVVADVLQRVRAVELRYWLVGAHYRSHVEFSEQALTDAATALTRIEQTLERARTALGSAAEPIEQALAAGEPTWTEGFAAAMDDDLSTPRALAEVQGEVRALNQALTAGDAAALADPYARVRGMLTVLGVDPLAPHWAGAVHDERRAAVLDALVSDLIEQRARARAEKDFATADAVRDRLADLGIVVEDGPQGSTWTLTD